MAVSIEIFGLELVAFNGGTYPAGVLNPSISFSLWIRDEELTKEIWEKLSEGGTVLMEYNSYPWSTAYGRCSDRYGVSRQVMYDDCEEHHTHQILPSLMFTQHMAGKAEEAINFYTSIFPASKIDSIFRYGPGEQDVEGTIAHAEFTLVNKPFIALDSSLAHAFTFNDGVSLSISCKDQEEIDYYRSKLTENGGQEVQCGWCKDKYGVSWQVTPVGIDELLSQPDKEKADAAMQKLLTMKKIIVAELYQ